MTIDWRHLFLSFQGRTGRIHFWIGFVIVIGASFLVNFVPILGQIAGLALLWPMCAIHAKRLHDMGRTAWLMVVPLVVSVALTVLAVVTGGATVLAALIQNDNRALATAAGGLGLTLGILLAQVLFGFGFLLWVGLSRGQEEPNRFGQPPTVS